MPYGLPTPQWGNAFAQAFQQGTQGVSGALRQKWLQRREEEERMRQEALRRDNLRLQYGEQITDTPRREEVKAPTAALPANQPQGRGADTEVDGHFLRGVSHQLAGQPAPMIQGTATAHGVAPVQGQLAEGMVDLGDEFAERNGFRFLDRHQTPEYRDQYSQALAQAMQLQPYMSHQDFDSMDLAELRGAVGAGQGTKERFLDDQDNYRKLLLEGAELPGQFRPAGLEESRYNINDGFELLSGAKSNFATHEQEQEEAMRLFEQNMARQRLALEQERVEIAREEARAAAAERAAKRKEKEGKGSAKINLTVANAESAHNDLKELGAPGFGSVVGETLATIAPQPLEEGLRRKWKGQDARTIEGASAAFTEGFLREVTGAAVAESEWPRYTAMFVPQAGDSKLDLARKHNRRERLLHIYKNLAAEGFSLEEIQPHIQEEALDIYRNSDRNEGNAGGGYTPKFEDNPY